MDSNTKKALQAVEEALNRGKGHTLDEQGRELHDPRPVAPPVGFVKQPSMVEHIRALVRSEMLRKEADDSGLDTFEEAEDFDTGEDDDDPRTPYEAVFEPPAIPLPGESSEPPPEPPEPRRDAPQAQGTRPKAGETAQLDLEHDTALAEPAAPPSKPPRPPNTSPKRSV